MSKLWKTLAVLAVAVLPVGAQVTERRASIRGGQPGGPGKCTIEVVVDVAAEIQITGDRAVMRTLGGQPAQWRRFECNVAMPLNPVGFRFEGVDGRGRQQLQADPGRGGPAIIRIDDPQGGSEGYTFDIFWNGVGQPPPMGGFGGDRDRGFDRDRPRESERTSIRPYAAAEATKACEDAAIDQANRRYRAQAVTIRRSAIDDGPGRNDWVIGTLEARRGRDWDTYRFSCSVDFRTRTIRSVNLEPAERRR